ncbi:MAG: hypothetical protein ACOY0T_30830 [Myxococcota bacterium]
MGDAEKGANAYGRLGSWAALVGAAVSIPVLFVGFSNDDLVHRLALDGQVAGFEPGWLGLYDFTPPSLPTSKMIERGMLPWFTNPELSLRFFRPISSLLLALDHFLFGRWALAAHLHSMLWMAALALLAAKLYARWLTPRAARAAAFVFALSGVHAVPTAWLASRHTLVSATLAVAALLAWARFREDGWRFGRALSPALLASSLLASESGLVGGALLVAYELGTRGIRRGAFGALPHAAVCGVYLGVYAALGYGARGSSFYVSPFDAPLRYLGAALVGVPTLSVELLLGLPSAVANFVPGASSVFVALGVGALLGFTTLLYTLREELPAAPRKNVYWLGLGALLGSPALVGAVVTGRVLPLPMFAAAAVIGSTLDAIWNRIHGARLRGASPLSKAWFLPLSVILLTSFGISPLLRVGTAFQFRHFAEAQRQLALEANLGTCKKSGFLYLLTAADPILALSTAPALRFHTEQQAHAEAFRVLSMAPQLQRLHRTAPNAFELEVLGAPRQRNSFEELYRAPNNPLLPGYKVRTEELTVTAKATDTGVFTRASFELPRDLESMNVCFLIWFDGKLQLLDTPSTGQSVDVPYERGPMGM